MHGEPHREIRYRRLCRRISGDLRQRRERVHARNVYYTAAAVYHAGGERLRREQSAFEIEIEHEADSVGIKIEKRFYRGIFYIARLEIFLACRRSRVVAAGAVYQYIAFAVFCFYRFVSFFQAFLIENAARYGVSLAAF